MQKQHDPAGSQKEADTSAYNHAARERGEGGNSLYEGSKGAKKQNHKQNGGIEPAGLSVWKSVSEILSVMHVVFILFKFYVQILS